jgi:hypothetical protein
MWNLVSHSEGSTRLTVFGEEDAEENSFTQRLKEVMLSLCLIKHHAMKTCGEVEVSLHTFFTSSLDRGEWPVSRPDRCSPGETVLFSVK